MSLQAVYDCAKNLSFRVGNMIHEEKNSRDRDKNAMDELMKLQP